MVGIVRIGIRRVVELVCSSWRNSMMLKINVYWI